MVAPDILAVIVEVRILLSQQILILKLTKITIVMKNHDIEERAKKAYPIDGTNMMVGLIQRNSYILGATEQKAIDDELCKSGEASDGYHTFNELYDIRREYNAALVNSGVWKAHKSHRHHSGELCFGGGWFIVSIETPFGQISNHYENKYWDEFHCEEKEFADEWDGHTGKDVIARLMKCNNQKQ